METPNDLKERLDFLNKHKVDYIIVDSYALAFHGVPRFTADMDVFVKPDKNNAERLLTALTDFGFSTIEIAIEDFTKSGNVIHLGVPPVRVDIITSLTGATWREAFDGKTKGKCGGVTVNYLGKEQFKINKKAAGRNKDLADLEALGEQ